MVFRKEVGAAVNDAVGPVQAGVREELRDIRRVLEDDMAAANEATAVFGRLLSQLRDRLDGIEEQLQSIAGLLESLEKPAPARGKAAPGSRSGSGKTPSASGSKAAPGSGSGSGSASSRDPAHPAG